MVTLWRNVKYHSFIHSLDGPLKIKTDGGRSRVRELGSIGSFSFYYNFVKRGPFATNFCTYHRRREQMLQIWLLYDF